MYKRICKFLNISLVFVIVVCSFKIINTDYKIEAYTIPDLLRVGLNTIEDSYSLSSDSGLSYGYYEGGSYKELGTVAKNTTIYIRKDAYFYNGTNLPVMYTSESSVPAGKNKYGPFRIQIGGDYGSFEDAKKAVSDISSKYKVVCYTALSGGKWKVCTGDYTSASNAESAITNLKKTDDKNTYSVIKQSSSALVIQDTSYNTLLYFEPGDKKFTVKPSEADLPLIKLGTKYYRGYLEFRRFSGRDITVINTLGFDEYLYGVLPTEVSAGWNLSEVFKAQAVTARNFAYVNYRASKHSEYDFNVCSTSCCQNYGGYSSEYKVTSDAVNATKGELLLYKGSPASIYYSASNGGYTEATQNVWSATIDYYKTAPDEYDPKDYMLYTMTAAEASATLKAKGHDVGDLQSIEIISRSESGRVLEMKITGTKGSKTITKSSTRGAFGLRNQMFSVRTDTVYTMIDGELTDTVLGYLNGSKYETVFIDDGTYTLQKIPTDGIEKHNGYYYEKVVIKNQNDKIYFDVYGNGHGVGMSQLGAKKMAELGKTYKEIMSFYYPGTTIG